MSEQIDTYAHSAFSETLVNYNRYEGETLLAPHGWVNYLDVIEQFAATGANDDKFTTAGWTHADSNLLKKATAPYHNNNNNNNNKATLIVHPHL